MYINQQKTFNSYYIKSLRFRPCETNEPSLNAQNTSPSVGLVTWVLSIICTLTSFRPTWASAKKCEYKCSPGIPLFLFYTYWQNNTGKYYDNTGKVCYVNYGFDCDSEGVFFLLKRERCNIHHVGSTFNSFRKRFNNHKNSSLRYGKGKGVYRVSIYISTFSQKAIWVWMMSECRLLTGLTLLNQQKGKHLGYLSTIHLFRKV